jgi:PRC-barrel domain
LKPLGGLHNYRIVEGDSDVRGWEVVEANGNKVGKVADLIVDTSAGKVLYLDVALLPDVSPENTAASTANSGLAPLVRETLVRATLSDEENALTQEHHPGAGNRHVLILVEDAHLDLEHEQVYLETLSAAQLAPGSPKQEVSKAG